MPTSPSQPIACAPRTGHASPRGAAAIVVVILMLVLNLIVIGLVVGGGREQDLAVRRLETVRAFYAAEGGVNMAMREILENADEDGDGAVGTISNDGNDANDPTIGTARVAVSASQSGTETTVESTGRAGQALRTAECIVEHSTGGTAQGLVLSYFPSSTSLSMLADVDWTAAPSESTIASHIDMAQTSGAGWPGGQTNNWGRRYTGYITIPTTGTWTFYTYSDDGSDLWINGSRVVNNDGLHSMATASGSVALTAGVHEFEARIFERTGDFGLVVSWSGPGVPTQTVIPATAFTH